MVLQLHLLDDDDSTGSLRLPLERWVLMQQALTTKDGGGRSSMKKNSSGFLTAW